MSTDKRAEATETERGAVAPGTGLILGGGRKARFRERALPADVLPDRSLILQREQLH